MKKIILLFTFLLTIAFKGYSQTGREVHGIVADSTGITIPGVVVRLTSPTDSLNVVTNVDGVFTFASVKSKQFALTILSIGYQGLKRNYTFDADNKPANIGMIKLKAETKLLNTVQITDVNAVKIKEDTTEYKASAYPVRANASTEDVLKKLPGVDVDASGNVTAEGKQVTKVRINGKDFFGGDVQTATKNLPADVIESIQMIDDYGDQANLTGIKSGEPNKIMNIVIRKDKNYGYSLSATGGDGADAQPSPATKDNRYLGAVNAFTFKGDQQISILGSINNTNINTFSFGGGGGNGGFGGGGGRGNGGRGGGGFGGGGGATTSSAGITDAHSLGLNFRDQWGKNLSVYGSYSFADNTVNTVSSNTQINVGANPINNVSTSNETDRNTNHRLTWNMEWKPDTVNYFKFTPTFAYSAVNAQSLDNNVFSRNNATYLSYINNNFSNSTAPNFGLNVLYNHRFNGHGRNLSINLTGSTSTSDSYQNPIYKITAGSITNPANQQINIDNKSNSEGATVSYIEPLGKITYLEASYAFNRSYSVNDRQTDSLLNSTPVFLDKYSNHYTSTFTTNRFALNYRVVDKMYNYTLGLGVQPATLVGYSPATASQVAVNTNISTVNFSPTARYIYNFSRSQALSFNYNGASTQPSYTQLNPRLDISNAAYPIQGNPNLRPEFNNNFSLRYNQFSFGTGNLLFTNISFTQAQDKIITNNVIYPAAYSNNPDLAGKQVTEYSNADGYYSGSGFFAFSKPWQQRKYTLTINGNASYTNAISNIITIDPSSYARIAAENTAKTLVLTPGARFRVDIQDVIDAQLSTNYSISKTNNSLQNSTTAINSNYRTLTVGLNGKNYFWKDWTLSYDYTKKVYTGFVGATNPNILNAYVERRFLKNNAATIRLAAYDLFNENTSFTSTTTGTQTTSTQSNTLGRYFLATLTIRLQKFAGKAPSQDPGAPGERRMRGMGGQGGGNGGGGGGFGGPGGGPQ